MLIEFDKIDTAMIPHLNGGEGEVSAKMYMQSGLKLMRSELAAGCSIGLHTHTTSCEINFVVSGSGVAVCGGAEEALRGGTCHYCEKGQSHSIANTGTEPLVMLTAVVDK